MRLGSIQNNIKKIYIVAGTPQKTDKLTSIIKESETKKGGFVLIKNITNLLKKKSSKYGKCSKLIKNGNDILIIITGKNDCTKNSSNHKSKIYSGFKNKLYKFINLSNYR